MKLVADVFDQRVTEEIKNQSGYTRVSARLEDGGDCFFDERSGSFDDLDYVRFGSSVEEIQRRRIVENGEVVEADLGM